MKDCAPPTSIALWRARVLAFLGAGLFGLVVPTGCIVVPEGGYPTRESFKEFFVGSAAPCSCGRCAPGEATCGLPSEDCAVVVPANSSCNTAATAACDTPCDAQPKLWHRLHLHQLHLHHLHLYDPEAGIFNFCVPPQCLNPPPPLPPGRFFPVPVQPAFAQRADYGYNMVGGAYSSGDCEHRANAPCR